MGLKRKFSNSEAKEYRDAEQVKQDLEGMQTMRRLGANMAWLLKCIKAGKKAGIKIPEAEETQRTDFFKP